MLSIPAQSTTRSNRINIRLLDIVIVFTIVGLVAGGLIISRQLIDSSKLRAQVSQIALFDSATATFYEKYDGLPGDLISAKAEEEGLPFGDGKPGHGDGDGKISPCNLGWQWNLGCETLLFWADLSAVGLIPQDFRNNTNYVDNRIDVTQLLDVYLPVSPLSNSIFITVWNTDESVPSPGQPLPYGNYFEVSRMDGIQNGRIVDNNRALTPSQAHEIDLKIDDGYPLTGRVVVNGSTDWPNDAWGSFASPGTNQCVSMRRTYNTQKLISNYLPLCHLAIQLECCQHNNK